MDPSSSPPKNHFPKFFSLEGWKMEKNARRESRIGLDGPFNFIRRGLGLKEKLTHSLGP